MPSGTNTPNASEERAMLLDLHHLLKLLIWHHLSVSRLLKGLACRWTRMGAEHSDTQTATLPAPPWAFLQPARL